MRMLAGPPFIYGRAVKIQVRRDQVRARPDHVRGIRGQPLTHLLQLGSQLLLARSFTLPPIAALLPHRTPATAVLTGRIHRDTARPLDSLTTTARGRAPGALSPNLVARRTASLGPADGASGLARGRLWGFCGGFEDHEGRLRHEDHSFLRFRRQREVTLATSVSP